MPSRHAFLTFPQVILRHALHVDSRKGKAHIHISRGLSLLKPRPIIHISMFLKTLHTDVREELCLDVVFCRSVSLARLIITHLQKTTSKLALARAKLEYFLSIKENYCSANEGQRVMFCKYILFSFPAKALHISANLTTPRYWSWLQCTHRALWSTLTELERGRYKFAFDPDPTSGFLVLLTLTPWPQS